MELAKLQEVPCWYELSFLDHNPPVLVLKIRKEFLAENILRRSTLEVERLQKEFGFGKFEFSRSKGFGFKWSFKAVGERDRFAEFAVTVPQIESTVPVGCIDCNYTGVDVLNSLEKCKSCRASRKKLQIDMHKAREISGSLAVIMRFLAKGKNQTQSESKQLLTLLLVCRKGMGGGEINAQFSSGLEKWLISQPHGVLDKVSQAIVKAWDRLYLNTGKVRLDGCLGRITSSKSLLLTCPGNCEWIYPPSEPEFLEEEGDADTVDTPAQQIAILCGLAALHDLARKGGL